MGKFDRFFSNGTEPAAEEPSRDTRGCVRGLPEGEWVSKGVYRIESAFKFGCAYGKFTLADPDLAETMRRAGAAERVVFLDLETTGLSGGAGTYAFLCGLGASRGEFFSVTQYFLKSPAYEAEWLSAIDADIPRGAAIATYNGMTFDVPMLRARHTMTRTSAHWDSSPHIDLLRFTRRLYRGRLESCSLGAVERRVLGLRRSGEDVPGHMIPELYLRYLSAGDAAPLGGVFYHNRLDIASLASLYCYIAGVLGGASGDGEELLRAGDFWHEIGFVGDAVKLWRMAESDSSARNGSFVRRAFLAKKEKRHADAREMFGLALEGFRRGGGSAGALILALEELAKLEEHRFMAPRRALGHVQAALDILRRARRYGGIPNAEKREAMERRRARLEKKIADGKCRDDGQDC